MPNADTVHDLQMRIAYAGDMKAYKELYLLMFHNLHRFSCSLVKSKEVAEEVVSDVFIKLWQIRDQLGAIRNLKVYLYCITKNLSLNYLAQAGRNPSVQLDEIEVESAIELNTPEDLYISSETVKNIKQAVQDLPAQCRIIFLLVRDQGMTYKEVAKILNISVFTVRNQVAIATRKIAEALPAGVPFLLHFRNKFSAS